MKTGRITVEGNGMQAPYGIGEIIESFRATDAGLKKAMRPEARIAGLFVRHQHGQGSEPGNIPELLSLRCTARGFPLSAPVLLEGRF